jgi:fluoroacetyl-CoA thioesterase
LPRKQLFRLQLKSATATVESIEIDGRKLVFAIEAHDGVDLISKGLHERFIINKEKFDAKVSEKRKAHS